MQGRANGGRTGGGMPPVIPGCALATAELEHSTPTKWSKRIIRSLEGTTQTAGPAAAGAAACDACACLPAMLRACMAWAWAAAAGLLSVRGQSRAHSSGESGDTQTTEADEDLLIFSAWAWAAGPDLSGGDATGISARRETERFRGCHNPSRTGLTNLA
jgi:hypothetical protein